MILSMRIFVCSAEHPKASSIQSIDMYLSNILLKQTSGPKCHACLEDQANMIFWWATSKLLQLLMSFVCSKWLLNIARECKFDVSDLNLRLYENSQTIRNLFILFMIMSFNVSYEAMFNVVNVPHMSSAMNEFSSTFHWHIVVTHCYK